MNKCNFMGRLTRDPQIKAPSTPDGKLTARYTIAIDRRYKNQAEETADFIPCVAFGSGAEFTEKYLKQGMKMIVSGRIQTGSYTNKDGVKIPSFNLIVEDQEFAESKAANEHIGRTEEGAAAGDDYINIPDGIEDEGLPFK